VQATRLRLVGKAITGLFAVGFASILAAEMLESVNVPYWGNYAYIGAIVIFVALAALLGSVFGTGILASMDFASGLTTLLMWFIYFPASIMMGVLFALLLLLSYINFREP